MKNSGALRLAVVLAVIIAAIWVLPMFLSVDSGFKFGWPYRTMFTLFALFAGFLFYLLRMPPTRAPRSTAGALLSVVLVFLISVGIVVLLANLAPQSSFEATGPAGSTAEERGKVVFNSPNAGCFLCHAVAGAGGTRGPDLSHIATVSGNRRQGKPAEEYLRESLLDPSAIVVSPYDNIMPPTALGLTPEELSDLIAYLKGLK